MCLERRFSLVWRRAPWWKILLRMFPETKKRPCPYTWDKSVNFCDTTQIDICENVHSLTRTIIRAPMDNGWGPVSPYWNNSQSFKAALGSPFTDGKAFRFHHPELSVAIHRSDTLLPHRFICVLRYMHYKHTQKDLSTIKIKKMQENEKRSVFLLFTENLEMKMWTLAVRQEQQVEKVFEKV